jgi:hypothetical protein
VLAPPPQPVFGPSTSSSTCDTAADVFGTATRAPKCDGYATDSESESGGEGRGAIDDDGYAWGPEDDAPLPPESQMSVSLFRRALLQYILTISSAADHHERYKDGG